MINRILKYINNDNELSIIREEFLHLNTNSVEFLDIKNYATKLYLNNNLDSDLNKKIIDFILSLFNNDDKYEIILKNSFFNPEENINKVDFKKVKYLLSLGDFFNNNSYDLLNFNNVYKNLKKNSSLNNRILQNLLSNIEINEFFSYFQEEINLIHKKEIFENLKEKSPIKYYFKKIMYSIFFIEFKINNISFVDCQKDFCLLNAEKVKNIKIQYNYKYMGNNFYKDILNEDLSFNENILIKDLEKNISLKENILIKDIEYIFQNYDFLKHDTIYKDYQSIIIEILDKDLLNDKQYFDLFENTLKEIKNHLEQLVFDYKDKKITEISIINKTLKKNL